MAEVAIRSAAHLQHHANRRKGRKVHGIPNLELAHEGMSVEIYASGLARLME